MRSLFLLGFVFAVPGNAFAGWGAGSFCSSNDGYCCINHKVVCNSGCGCEGGGGLFASEKPLAESRVAYVVTCRTENTLKSAINYALGVSVIAHVRQTYRLDVVTTTDMCWGSPPSGCGGDIVSKYDAKIATGRDYTSFPNLERLEWVDGYLEFSEWQGASASGHFFWNGKESRLACQGNAP